MKDMLLYSGCTTPVRLPQYEAATKLVLERLGVRTVYLNNANCCGAQYIESLSDMAHTMLGARILAMAEKRKMDILAICGACSGSLKKCKHLLDNDETARAEVNEFLSQEGLEYKGRTDVKHLLQVFKETIGFTNIQNSIINPYSDVRLAAHYGCHVTRPHQIVQVDDPNRPSIIDRIIEIAGATPVNYPAKTRCCGGPLMAMDPDNADKIGIDKIRSIRMAGAEGIITSCAFCNIQLTQVQFGEKVDSNKAIPVLTLPQFLGVALDIDDESLGIPLNRINPEPVLAFSKGGR